MSVKRKQFLIFLRNSRLLSQVMTIFIPRHLQNMMLSRSKRSYMKTYIYIHIYISLIVWYNNENISLFQKRTVICLALLPFPLTSTKKQRKNKKTRKSPLVLSNYILYSINSLHFSSTTHRAYLRI